MLRTGRKQGWFKCSNRKPDNALSRTLTLITSFENVGQPKRFATGFSAAISVKSGIQFILTSTQLIHNQQNTPCPAAKRILPLVLRT